eukprot:363520-Chlamydomonas_euryale.AAC.7
MRTRGLIVCHTAWRLCAHGTGMHRWACAALGRPVRPSAVGLEAPAHVITHKIPVCLFARQIARVNPHHGAAPLTFSRCLRASSRASSFSSRSLIFCCRFSSCTVQAPTARPVSR